MQIYTKNVWLDIFVRKYLIQGSSDFRRNVKLSEFARDVKKVQPLLRLGTKFMVHNSKTACFWLDCWCGEDKFRDSYPHLFAITDQPRGWRTYGGRIGGNLGSDDP